MCASVYNNAPNGEFVILYGRAMRTSPAALPRLVVIRRVLPCLCAETEPDGALTPMIQNVL